MTRRCRNCSIIKPLDEFYKKLAGHQYRCKACNNEVVRGYYDSRRRKRFPGYTLKEMVKIKK